MYPYILDWQALRALRANRVSCTDEKHIRTRNTVLNKIKTVWLGLSPRSSLVHGCAFHPCASEDPRGRDAVRASRNAAVRGECVHPTILARPALRALRANRVCGTDEKRIRSANTVLNEIKTVWLSLYPRSSMAYGCAFHPCASEDPRGRDAVRASKSATVRAVFAQSNILDRQALRALRANPAFGTDEKHIRTKSRVLDKPRGYLGWHLSNIPTLQQGAVRYALLRIEAGRCLTADAPGTAP